MPAEVIKRVHTLARRGGAPAGLAFANRAGQILVQANHGADAGHNDNNEAHQDNVVISKDLANNLPADHNITGVNGENAENIEENIKENIANPKKNSWKKMTNQSPMNKTNLN
jgi:hypothetical protein